MLTPKENWLIAAKGGKPAWVPSFTEDANVFLPPIWGMDPETGTDFCNVNWVTDDTGEMPDPNWRAMGMRAFPVPAKRWCVHPCARPSTTSGAMVR